MNVEVAAYEAAVPKVAAPEVTTPEPPMKSCILEGCSITDDFKVESQLSKQDWGDGACRYICSITKDVLLVVREDYKWEGKDVVVLRPEDDITTHVEGYLTVFTYPFMLGVTPLFF